MNDEPEKVITETVVSEDGETAYDPAPAEETPVASLDCGGKEFSELYPDIDPDTLPDAVKADVAAGVPLAAAYALYERRRAVREGLADEINRKNSGLSFGLKKNTEDEAYFTPAEVREMSRAEVRKNYDKIIDSMSHWH